MTTLFPDPHALLAVLAPEAPDGWDVARAWAAVFERGDVASETLHGATEALSGGDLARLAAGPGQVPPIPRHWIESVVALDLAAAALEGSARHEPFLTSLSKGLENAESVARAATDSVAWFDHPWAFHPVAARCAPWRWQSSPTDLDLVEAWIDGRLPDGQARVLSDRVASGDLVSSLRQSLQARIVTLRPSLGEARWSRYRLADAPPLAVLPLPHLGPDARVEIRRVPVGLWVVTPYGEAVHGVDVGSFDVVDPVVGPLRFTVSPVRADALADARGALATLDRLELPLDDTARDIVASVVEALTTGAWSRRLTQAAQAARALLDDHEPVDALAGLVPPRLELVTADPAPTTVVSRGEAAVVDLTEMLGDTHQAWTDVCVTARRRLDALLGDGSDLDLVDQVAFIDVVHAKDAMALTWLPGPTWDELADDPFVDDEAWWGAPARVARALSPRALAAALAEDPLSGFVAPEERAVAAKSADLTDPGLATTTRPVGVVPFLVVEPGGTRGRVLGLCIRPGPGLFGAHDRWVRSDTLLALRDAYDAAAACTGNGLAPRDFTAHCVEIWTAPGQRDELELSGDSIGLAAALAFASCWSGRPLPLGVGATGATRRDGRITDIGGLGAKAKAFASPQGRRVLLVPSTQEDQVVQAGLTVRGVSTVKEALGLVGLELDAIEPTPGRLARRRRMKDLIATVEHGEREEVADLPRLPAGGPPPWSMIASELVEHVVALGAGDSDANLRNELITGATWAAMAFAYGGQDDRAWAVLEDMVKPRCEALGRPLPQRVAALIDVIELAQAILHERWEEAEALDADLARWEDQLLGEARIHLFGKAVGTRGRYRLHRPASDAATREADRTEALVLIERAVAHHQDAQREELPRSLVYVAMAQRALGRPADALETLARSEAFARQYLEVHSVLQSHMTFVLYNRARCVLELGDAEAADRIAREALDLTETFHPGPQAGILRVLAWAAEARGDEVARTAWLRDLDTLTASFTQGFRARIRTEAHHRPSDPRDEEVW